MRWEDLFQDLELQAAAISAAELEAEVAERIRIEDSRISWVQRLRANVEREVDIDVRSLGRVSGVLTRVGRDFALLTRDERALVVPLSAVVSVAGLSPSADTTSAEGASTRLGLGSALRALALGRAAVTLYCLDGSRHTGTPARVGADYVEVVVRIEKDRRRDSGERSHRVVVPFGGVVLVRRAEP